MSQLIKIFDISDWNIQQQSTLALAASFISNKCDFLVYLVNKICIKDVRNFWHFVYIIRNFNIQESKTNKNKMESK